jgi:uncharacterized protein (AIM24 family)
MRVGLFLRNCSTDATFFVTQTTPADIARKATARFLLKGTGLLSGKQLSGSGTLVLNGHAAAVAYAVHGGAHGVQAIGQRVHIY